VVLNFDFVAPFYRILERIVFGRALERRRFAMLRHLGVSRRALLIGEGDGRFLQQYREMFPTADVDVIEQSRTMIRLAEQRLHANAGTGIVRFLRQSVAEGPYDTVATNFVLDVMTCDQVRELIDGMRDKARGARWVVSEFRIVESAGLRTASAAMIRIMYWFFAVTAGVRARAVPDYAAEFRSAGFKLIRSETEWRGFLVSELWQVP
jgi:hypothetical protein